MAIVENPAGERNRKSRCDFAITPWSSGRAMTDFGLALLLILVWVYVIGTTILALRFARRRIVAPPGVTPRSSPPISVLKPLHGAEPGLSENLRSFADQDYPVFQLLLGVRDRNDGALPVANALIKDRPLCDIELVVDPRAAGS